MVVVAGVDSAVAAAWSPPPSAVGGVGVTNEWCRESLDSSNCNEEDVRSDVSCDVLRAVVVVVKRNRSFCDRNTSRRRSSKLLLSGPLLATIFASTVVDVVVEEEGFLVAAPGGDDDDGVVLDRLLMPLDEELELRVDSDRETNPMINRGMLVKGGKQATRHSENGERSSSVSIFKYVGLHVLVA